MDNGTAALAIFSVILGVPGFVWLMLAAMRHEERKLQLKHGAGGEEAARLNAVVDQLSAELVRVKDRLNVLERLATDEDRKLAGEIEALRKREAADARG